MFLLSFLRTIYLGMVAGDQPQAPTPSIETIKIVVPGMPSLSKRITNSVASYEAGGATVGSNLDMDMTSFEKRARQYFFEKCVKKAVEASKDINENPDGTASVHYTDPLPFWVLQVS